jgi:hypothetical protein
MDFRSQRIGTIDQEGHLADATGQPVGEVRPDGDIFNRHGHYVGYVASGAGVPLGRKGGAALLLLPLVPLFAARQP